MYRGRAADGSASCDRPKPRTATLLLLPTTENGAETNCCRLPRTPSSPWQIFADLLDPPENPYVRDPVGWVRDRLGEFLWSKQREILEAVVHHGYVAVKSAHDTGKSHGASRAVAWWLDTREDPFATTTAPTTKQVHAILWRYIGQAHRKGNQTGRITLDVEWYMGPGGKELVAFGRKPADHDQSAFQGFMR
jgi:hypothetical protein